MNIITQTNEELGSVIAADFYPAAQPIEVPLEKNVFVPDEWTLSLAKGLQQLDFTGLKVIEIGIGGGINAAGLLTCDKPPADFVGVDIFDPAVTASRILFERHSLKGRVLKSNLLQNIDQQTLLEAHHIFACIPQVPSGEDLECDDNYSHYYKANGSDWDLYGLGLNEKLIRKTNVRASQTGITLNLSGRPGIDKLRELFFELGRNPEIIHAETVPQHAGTSVQSLADLEGNGHEDFEFFKDEDTQHKISAACAEQRRLAGDPVFHKIYVISAPGLRR